MKALEIENALVDGLEAASLPKFESSRTENGELVLRLESPCSEVGYIMAVVYPHEIQLSCKFTHTHIATSHFQEVGTATPEQQMISQAVTHISSFLHGEYCAFVEIAHNGSVVGSGWGPISAVGKANKEYLKLVEKMFGGPSTYRAWSWAGELNITP